MRRFVLTRNTQRCDHNGGIHCKTGNHVRYCQPQDLAPWTPRSHRGMLAWVNVLKLASLVRRQERRRQLCLGHLCGNTRFERDQQVVTNTNHVKAEKANAHSKKFHFKIRQCYVKYKTSPRCPSLTSTPAKNSLRGLCSRRGITSPERHLE